MDLVPREWFWRRPRILPGELRHGFAAMPPNRVEFWPWAGAGGPSGLRGLCLRLGGQ
jgi:hypothetical protein